MSTDEDTQLEFMAAMRLSLDFTDDDGIEQRAVILKYYKPTQTATVRCGGQHLIIHKSQIKGVTS